MNIKETDVCYIPIAHLRPNEGQIEGVPANPRQINEKEYAKLKKSLKADNLTGVMPLKVVWHDGAYIVLGGNMRLRALRELGETDVQCIVVPDDAPVDVLRKIVVTDNSTFGEWDTEALANEWNAEELGEWGVEVPEFATGGADIPKEAQEDAFDPEKDEVQTRVKKGDIWQLGEHRVCCGDSTNAEQVAALFGGEQPYAILTDPPYCSGGFQESGKRSGSIGTRSGLMIANDTLSTRGYSALIKRVFECAGDCAMAYVFTDWRMFVNLFDIVESCGFGVRNMIVWDKTYGGLGIGWRAQHELCLFASRAAQKFNPHLAQGNVIQCARTGNENHPTEKPVDLLYKILRVSDMAKSVYDPFGGSGTTLIAAEQLDRKCFMMEIDEHYCDVIIARWEKFTGKQAHKIQ